MIISTFTQRVALGSELSFDTKILNVGSKLTDKLMVTIILWLGSWKINPVSNMAASKAWIWA